MSILSILTKYEDNENNDDIIALVSSPMQISIDNYSDVLKTDERFIDVLEINEILISIIKNEIYNVLDILYTNEAYLSEVVERISGMNLLYSNLYKNGTVLKDEPLEYAIDLLFYGISLQRGEHL
jgi:hypothetical protein